VITGAPTSLRSVPVEYDPDASVIRVPLGRLTPEANSTIRFELHDPAGSIWLGATESNSYPDGARTRDGQPIGGDLAFRVVYRTSLMEVMVRGISEVAQAPGVSLSLLITLAVMGFCISGLLSRLVNLDWATWFSLAIGGGVLLTTALAYLFALLQFHPSPGWIALTMLPLAALGVFGWSQSKSRLPLPAVEDGFLVLFLLVMGAVRLAFSANVSLPLHVDSIENYSIVLDILHSGKSPLAVNQIGNLLSSYYHFGYHVFAAWLMGLAGTESPRALALITQALQTIAIGALYFPVRMATHDRSAATASVVFAAIGWTMPAFSSNWGKVSALSGLTTLPTVVGLALLIARERVRGWPWVAVGVAAGVAILLHTRIVFILVSLGIAVGLARAVLRVRQDHGGRLEWGILGVVAVASLLLVLRADPAQLGEDVSAMATVLEGQGAVTTVAVLLLLPFALHGRPFAALITLLWIGALFGLHLVPPHARYPFPLLDGPMLSMALFLPLCALGGMGYAGLISMVRQGITSSWLRAMSFSAIAVGSVAMMGFGLAHQVITPDDCCMIAGRDDLAVIQQLDQEIGPNATVLTAGDAPGGYTLVPKDGGGWIRPLTRRETVGMRPHVDFTTAAMHRWLCEMGVSHIYLGMRSESFDRASLDLAPDYYAPSIVYPRASLYAVIACSGVQ
jgi:hypothetical protein